MSTKYRLPARFAIAVVLVTFSLPFARASHADSTPPFDASPQAVPSPDAISRTFRVYLPGVSRTLCPSTGTGYELIPVLPPATDRPAAIHADVNLALRGSTPVNAALTLVDYGGPTDGDAPLLSSLFQDGRVPTFASTHQVYDWNWSCGANGCRSVALSWPPVTLLGMAANTGERLYPPSRGVEIYGGGYVVLVLYAEDYRLTLKYTRQDNVVQGYTVHLEEICVDPNLLRLYRTADAAGRGSLPALRSGQPLGTAHKPEFRAAIRDSGSYMDPRSRKDWW